MRNGDILAGEIKSLDKGVLVMETDYSKSDFSIKWNNIREIYSSSRFLIRLKDGRSLNGNIRHLTGQNKMIIGEGRNLMDTVSLSDIVFVKGVKSDFWGRMTANLDIGITFAKANELRQYSMRAGLGYVSNRWQTDANYSLIVSTQSGAKSTKRSDGAANFKYYLQQGWFGLFSVNTLSNTEQALALRLSGRVGAGKMIFQTNRRYWGVGSGLSFNNERFTNGTEKRNSIEAFMGSELNIFDKGDLSLLSSVYVFPSLTESGRWRSDIKLNLKYDLPWDFYLKPSFTVNYDNRPAITGRDWDYVFVFTVGWEF